jgi:nucleoid-associated protein YgaU
VVTVFLLLLSGVALAQPAVDNRFVPVSPTPASGAGTMIVQPGDHLWKISQTRLDLALGRRATAVEVDPYWRDLIELNRQELASGDPDLIFPGEVIHLPPPAP